LSHSVTEGPAAAGLAPIRCHAAAPLFHLTSVRNVLRVGRLAERLLQDRADLTASLHLAYSRGATLRALAACRDVARTGQAHRPAATIHRPLARSRVVTSC